MVGESGLSNSAAHTWRQQLEAWLPEKLSDLAAATGIYAWHFIPPPLRIACQPPDIIEAIIEGRQLPELTANKLVRMKDLPISWADQRGYLDFPAA